MILLLVLTPGTVITDRHILFTKQGSVFIVILLNTLFQNFFFTTVQLTENPQQILSFRST